VEVNNVRMRAFAYLRTSSAANLDGDSDDRQREAIQRYAAGAGIEIAGEYYDEAVSGTDPIETRAGFAAMLSAIEASDIRLVLVEDASRLARSVLAGELAAALLVKRGVRVLASNGDDLTESDDPMRVAMRQMALVFVEAEKRRLVQKLKHARDAKRAATGRCGGRVGYDQTAPQLVATAKELRAEGMTQRAISAALQARGFVTATGKALSAGQIGRILADA
jgi:DNA invertase Pin-like site-specific DNA recombinase